MPEEQTPPAPVEAREVPPWRPGDGPVLARTWTRGGPAVEVYVGGEWRLAPVLQRQDWASGRITYHVMVVADPAAGSPSYRVYLWDPRAIRPSRPATAAPVERTWS
ncbi:hypothetical protein NMG29_06720 [Streptomyces cocklensis]|uniref:Eukaryotic translation initiation factor 4B n=1 Tax=Actinacidiphila cocklensis TaxID=887465 RepID=A0A9W4E4Q2_9ACTN|nr:hypothetical protein [Actinacidiphila cocklensis]MDD1057925.1 hypothetical protein [Actinacidiphila cocklensis]CAG6392792.1 Eukaryotic translation initiation factor 4B [Actinacidiphila cocklensis]